MVGITFLTFVCILIAVFFKFFFFSVIKHKYMNIFYFNLLFLGFCSFVFCK